MSSAAASAIAPVQYARMQSAVSRVLCKIMMGLALHERHDWTTTNTDERPGPAFFDNTPMHTELTVRRLRMFVGVVADPGHHEVLAPAMFST